MLGQLSCRPLRMSDRVPTSTPQYIRVIQPTGRDKDATCTACARLCRPCSITASAPSQVNCTAAADLPSGAFSLTLIKSDGSRSVVSPWAAAGGLGVGMALVTPTVVAVTDGAGSLAGGRAVTLTAQGGGGFNDSAATANQVGEPVAVSEHAHAFSERLPFGWERPRQGVWRIHVLDALPAVSAEQSHSLCPRAGVDRGSALPSAGRCHVHIIDLRGSW